MGLAAGWVRDERRRVPGLPDQAQGTAGQLLQDRPLCENMTEGAAELRALPVEVRQNPTRFLNVKLDLVQSAHWGLRRGAP